MVQNSDCRIMIKEVLLNSLFGRRAKSLGRPVPLPSLWGFGLRGIIRYLRGGERFEGELWEVSVLMPQFSKHHWLSPFIVIS